MATTIKPNNMFNPGVGKIEINDPIANPIAIECGDVLTFITSSKCFLILIIYFFIIRTNSFF